MKTRYQAPEGSLRAALAGLPDPRRGQGRVHGLSGMMALRVCVMVCGARSRYAAAPCGQECGAAIRVAVGLRAERGPSVAMLHRAFRERDHQAFEAILTAWFTQQGRLPGEGIARDGKTLRGMQGESLPGVHVIAAYAHQTRVGFAPAATTDKVAGVTAVVAALPQTLLAGHVLTGAALLATHDRCAAQRAKRGYFFGLKGTCPATWEAVRTSFADPQTPRERDIAIHRHGDRAERRTREVRQEIVPHLDWPTVQ